MGLNRFALFCHEQSQTVTNDQQVFPAGFLLFLMHFTRSTFIRLGNDFLYKRSAACRFCQTRATEGKQGRGSACVVTDSEQQSNSCLMALRKSSGTAPCDNCNDTVTTAEQSTKSYEF